MTATLSQRHQVEITHADRVLFPGDGITKRDVAEHYRRVAGVMLPHVKGRPLTLQRFPRGISAQGFIQQDISNSAPPDWLGRAVVDRGDGGDVEHAVVNHPEDLAWLANQNVITPHSWLSRTAKLRIPDRLIIDLDPSGADFGVVRATACAARDLLADLGLTAYAQLTGSRGIHVVTPLAGDADFDSVREFARQLAEVLVADDPAHRTLAVRKAARDGQVYLDIMRNCYAQTAVAPYAIRPRRGAPVATPVRWDELRARGMRADRYTLRTIGRRLARVGDPWHDMARHSRALTTPRKQLSGLRDRVTG
jgi:bifunctional non-homologous end joining protein LigD